MPTKIQNKMYILSGGLVPDDQLCDFRFQTMQGLNKVPRGYIHRIFDEALEVDLTGRNVEFDKLDTDSYWTCCSELCLKDVKIRRIAFIDRKWRTVDIDPFDDVDEFLRANGFDRKLDYGGGWFSKNVNPTYKELVFDYFASHGRNNVPEYDLKTKMYAGIRADHRHDELKIYNGHSSNWIETYVGSIRVEDDTVVIKMHDDVYKFKKETDEDFIRWTKMCNDGFNQIILDREKEENTIPANVSVISRCNEAKAVAKHTAEDEEFEKFLESRTDFEIELAQKSFHRNVTAYFEAEPS